MISEEKSAHVWGGREGDREESEAYGNGTGGQQTIVQPSRHIHTGRYWVASLDACGNSQKRMLMTREVGS